MDKRRSSEVVPLDVYLSTAKHTTPDWYASIDNEVRDLGRVLSGLMADDLDDLEQLADLSWN